MKESGKRFLVYGITLVAAFIIWTVMIQSIDVQPLGVNGTDISFAECIGSRILWGLFY